MRTRTPMPHPQDKPLPERKRPVVANSAEALKGLTGVYVLVDDMRSSDARALGLKTSDIQTRTEEALKRHGVPVLTKLEMMRTPGGPWIHVDVRLTRQAYTVKVAIRETVMLERSATSKVGGASIWERITVDTHGGKRGVILDDVAECVGKFADDYFEANPK